MSRLPVVLVLTGLVAAVAVAKPPKAPPPAEVSTTAAATAAPAAPAPADVIAYRETVMGSMGKHMKALGMILKGKVDRPGDVVGHAEALHAAAKDLAALFPAGTGPDNAVGAKTEATAEIWARWADFEAAAGTYATETATLVTLAKADDREGFAAQLGKVGESCGGCHDAFKAEH